MEYMSFETKPVSELTTEVELLEDQAYLAGNSSCQDEKQLELDLLSALDNPIETIDIVWKG